MSVVRERAAFLAQQEGEVHIDLKAITPRRSSPGQPSSGCTPDLGPRFVEKLCPKHRHSHAWSGRVMAMPSLDTVGAIRYSANTSAH